MQFYIILLTLVAASSVIVSYSKNKKIVWLFKVITFLLISVPGAIRYGIGVDYESYTNIFYEIKHTGTWYGELGYLYLNLWIADAGGNEQWVFAIMAFATAYFFFKGVPAKQWCIFAPMFILALYGWYFSTVRQMFAASLAFYAWRKMNEQKCFPAILAIVVAFFFHYSSLLYPFIYLICKYVRISRKIAVCLFFTSIVLAFVFSSALTTAMAYLVSFSEKYGGYANGIWFLPQEMGSGLVVFVNYITWLIMIFFFPLKKDEKSQFTYTLFSIFVVLMIFSVPITIISRIPRGIIFVLLPFVWYLFSDKYKMKPVILPLILLLYFLVFIARLIKQDPNFLPFQTCF